MAAEAARFCSECVVWVSLRACPTDHAALPVYGDLLDVDLTDAEQAITPSDSHD